jgi:hypothetical protein
VTSTGQAHDPDLLRELSLQFLTGVVMGGVHLALSLELALSASLYRTMVRTLILMLYPAALALTGLGSYLQARRPELGSERGLRAAGALLVMFLGLVLVAPISGVMGWDLLLLGSVVLVTLGGWYLLLGAVITRSLQRLRDQGHVSLGWGVHLAGLMVGYGLSEPLVVAVGANAAILLTGLALVAGGRQVLPLWALLQALGIWLPIDQVIEDYRRTEVLLPEAPETNDRDGEAMAQPEILDTDWMGWSRRSQVRLVRLTERRGGRQQFRVLYNFANQYRVDPEGVAQGQEAAATNRRGRAYKPLDGADRVLLIGAGSGRGLLSLPVELDKDVHAVERNPAAMRLFRDVAPQLNGRLYHRVSAHASDGRTVVERLPGGWDGVVVESSLYHPAHLLLPASAPYFHQTAEAYVVMRDRLAPGGLIIQEYNRTTTARHRKDMAWRARSALIEADMEVRVLSSGPMMNLYVYACAEAGCGDALQERMELDDGDRWVNPKTDRNQPALRDDQPFMTWFILSRGEQIFLIGLAAIFLLIASGLALRERRTANGAGDWRNASIFVALVGTGHMALQLHAFHLARTLLDDSVRTVLICIVAFLFWGALGSLGAERWRRLLTPTTAVAGAAGLLALHWFGLAHLPFAVDTEWIRWAAMALATAPGGLLMGALLPLGLRRASPRQLHGLIAVDAAGTLAGYALVYPVMLPLGATALGVVAVATYLVAAWVLASAGSSESTSLAPMQATA